jgi:hypothetical protein
MATLQQVLSKPNIRFFGGVIENQFKYFFSFV